MKRSEWIRQNFTHVTLTENVGNLRVPRVNVDLTYGLISTEDKEEFSKLVFHLMPLGTEVDEIPDEFYEGKLLLLRNMLTRMLMEEPNNRMAERYLAVLERRDKAHWGKEQKQVKAELKEDKTFTVEFNVV